MSKDQQLVVESLAVYAGRLIQQEDTKRFNQVVDLLFRIKSGQVKLAAGSRRR